MDNKPQSLTQQKTYPPLRKSDISRKSHSSQPAGGRIHTKPTKLPTSRPTNVLVSQITNNSTAIPAGQLNSSSPKSPTYDLPIGNSFLSNPLSPIVTLVQTSSALTTLTTTTVTTTSLTQPILSIRSNFRNEDEYLIPESPPQSGEFVDLPDDSKVSFEESNMPVQSESSEIHLLSQTEQEALSFELTTAVSQAHVPFVGTPALPITLLESQIKTGSIVVSTSPELSVTQMNTAPGDWLTKQKSQSLKTSNPMMTLPNKSVSLGESVVLLDEESPMQLDVGSQGAKRKPAVEVFNWADEVESSMANNHTSRDNVAILVAPPKPKRVKPLRPKRSPRKDALPVSTSGNIGPSTLVPTPVTTTSIQTGKAGHDQPFTFHGPSTSKSLGAQVTTSKSGSRHSGSNNKQSPSGSTAPPVVMTATSSRPPPIVCSGELSPTAIRDLKALSGKFQHEFEARYRNRRTVFQMRSSEDHKAMVQHLLSSGVPLHSWTLPEDRNSRIVIRGLHEDTPLSHIEEALTEQGIPFVAVVRMGSRGSDPVPWPLFMVTLQGTTSYQSALRISHLGRVRVQIEPFRGITTVVQCYRCQGFGHTSHNCHEKPICVKCAGEHRAIDCLKLASEDPLCCHCQGPHPANYSQCPQRTKWMNMRQNSKGGPQTSRPPAELAKPTVPGPSSFPPLANTVGRSFAEAARGGKQKPRPSVPRAPLASPTADSSVLQDLKEIVDWLRGLNICGWFSRLAALLRKVMSSGSVFTACEVLLSDGSLLLQDLLPSTSTSLSTVDGTS